MPLRDLLNMDSYAKVVARAWKDPAFKAKLLADPVAAVAEMDIAPPAGKTIKMVENTRQITYGILPAPRSATGLSDEDLEKAAVAAVPGLGVFHGSFDD